ncbi:hypothetical protein GCM10010329_15290 [Streptomyces spiroverticillatus]|uniref:Peptidoglycan binding-like domain-containing protein n=1 Tax=Streptomyces finlayi TaxID=67296 RepID=A0A919CCY0_9ACTN|nr:peptidoglycan-binding domain-containing protein [Streptomyces finlayi]GGZ94767.1 hypothetical protein GCM10010329_15290 [Streptomyces spiroverticillatus]GHD07106.1 hypothetical protein GCM10010334_59320 [Streptomyces finlayi]
MENGHLCPEFGTERAAPDESRPGAGAASCDCARRATEAHHAERTAQAADAEDFNPLRIRPYVNLSEPSETAAQHTPAPLPPHRPVEPPLAPAEQTMPLRPVPPAEPDGPTQPAPRARRRGPILLTAAATLAVLAGTAFAVGVFDPAPEDTRALPGGISTTPTSVTEATPSPTPSRTASATAAPTRKTLPTPTRASRSAAPTRKATTAPPKQPKPPEPTPTQNTPEPPEPPESESPTGTLAQGSTGPEVTELQDRLSQLGLYSGPADGRYTGRVTQSVSRFQEYMRIEDEPEGVYGPRTREALEGWTNEP